MIAPLIDPFARTIDYLRVSVTDRCDFRCTYCMPEEGMQWLKRSDVMSFEEIKRLARIFVERYGVKGIRLTGGEPTVRAHLPVLVSKLSKLVGPDGPVNLAMTTNGATMRLVASNVVRSTTPDVPTLWSAPPGFSMARRAKNESLPPLHIKTITSDARPSAGVFNIAGTCIHRALSLTLTCANGQCLQPLPQHLPRASCLTLVMTMYPLLGSM